MSGTTISTTITTGTSIQNPVLITDTGAIEINRTTVNFYSEVVALYASGNPVWSISNQGTLYAYAYDSSNKTVLESVGIRLESQGTIVNGSNSDTSAVIGGTEAGIAEGNRNDTIINYGTIGGVPDTTLLPFNGIVSGFGVVINGSELDRTALIIGKSSGVYGSGTDTVMNFSTIIGGDFAGVVLGGGGTLTNGSATDTTALIEDSHSGYGASFFGFLENFGTILGPTSHGSLAPSADGVFVENEYANEEQILINSGTITGFVGVGAASLATIENSGVIDGLGGTAVDGAKLLIVDPGAVFIGQVTKITELELNTGSEPGTISGVGSSFTGAKTIAFDPGASWLLSGNSLGLAAGETISGFAAPDTIILSGFTATSHNYLAGIGLELSDGLTNDTLDIAGSFNPNEFTISTGPDGTEIVVCYLRGTGILTRHGEVSIETLKIGDEVATYLQGFQPVKWIGRQSFARRFLANNAEQMPVRIAAGALGDGLPARDLLVSPGHSMLLQGQLVLARHLVNGVTVRQDFAGPEIHYYQIELDAHDCVLAEGCWSESYADCPGLRAQFHNAAAFYQLYPEYRSPHQPILCAPRPVEGAALAAALRPVAVRAAARVKLGRLRGWVDMIGGDGEIAGWAQDEAHPDLPLVLEILVAGDVVDTVLACAYRGDLAAAGLGAGRSGFSSRLPASIALSRDPKIAVRRLDGGAILPFSHAQRRRVA